MEHILSFIAGLGGRKRKGYGLLTMFEQMNAEFPEDVARRKSHIASSPYFNMAIGMLIILDSMQLGIGVDNAPGSRLEDRLLFFVFDFVFALFFYVEMLIRQHQQGWDYFIDVWNVFDYSLVVLNCADIVIAVSSQGSASIQLATTLRILRLLRVVRNIKGLKVFYGLWLIIQGILDSLRTVGWVALTLLIIAYCLAVALTTLVGASETVRELWPYSDQYVGSVVRSMWTVMQVVTLDNWASEIARPLLKVDTAAAIAVVFGIIICTFGLLNTILAVILEHIQAIARDSKDLTGKVLEKTEQVLLMSLADEFRTADVDGSGELEFGEFKRLIRTESFSFKLLLLGIRSDEAESLFELMDADKSGSVSPEEFIGGLQKLKGTAKGEDLVLLISFAQKQCLRASRFVDRVKHLSQKADMIQGRLNEIGKGIGHELKARKDASARNDDVWQKAAHRQLVIGKLDVARRVQFPIVGGGVRH